MPGVVRQLLATRIALRRPEPRRGRLRARPTSSGWGFAGLVFCAFLLSVNFSNNLIFALTFLLVGIALVGWWHTRQNLRDLALGDWRVEPVFAGGEAVCRLPVENRARTARHGLRATSPGCAPSAERHLRGGEGADLLLARPAPRRGRLAPAPAEVCSGFPLGLFEARLATGPLPACLVYPAPSGEQPLPDRPLDRQAHLGEEAGTFTDLRRYAPGDPLTRIHWQAFARFDELHTREFDGARGRPVLWLRWDDVRAADDEARLSQLCRWVLDAHKQNREYGLELPGRVIEPADGEPHLRACLEALALHGRAEEPAA